MLELEHQAMQECETAKLKLSDLKHMISETQNKIQQLHMEHDKCASQHQKNMKNLSNIQATQYLKVTKLTNDISNVESVLHTRELELGAFRKLSTEYHDEHRETKKETESMIADLQKRCQEIEEEIKSSYLHIQTDKDMELLIDTCGHMFQDARTAKDPHILPYLQDIYLKRREVIYNRRQELNRELAQVERTMNALSTNIKAKQEELSAAKKKQASLNDLYMIAKKLKRGF